jgi:hypothetical protein
MKLVRVAPLLLIALAPSIPRPLGACSLAPRDGGGWYEEPLLGDTGAPTQLAATYSIDRPAGDDDSNIGCMASCGPGPAYVVLQLSAVDDLTPAERIGYKFAIVGGQPPQQLQYDQVLVVDPYSETGTEIGLSFDRDTGSFSFDLEITAVDQNGNEGAPMVLRIEG